MPFEKKIEKTEVKKDTTKYMISFLDARNLLENALSTPEEKQRKKETLVRKKIHKLLFEKHLITEETKPHDIQLSYFPQGWSNSVFKAIIGENRLVARFPGNKSESFTNRTNERINAQIAAGLEISPKIVSSNEPEEGLLFTHYIDNAVPLTEITLKQEANLLKAIQTLKKLHQSTTPFAKDNDAFLMIERFTSILDESQASLPADCKQIKPKIDEIQALIAAQQIKKVPCHNDPSPPNFILADDRCWLVDWEVSGNNDPLYELVYIANRLSLNDEEDKHLLKLYYGELRDAEYHRFQLYKPVIKYFGMLWTLTQKENGNTKAPPKFYQAHAEKLFNECVKLLDSPLFLAAKEFFTRTSKTINKDWNTVIHMKPLIEAKQFLHKNMCAINPTNLSSYKTPDSIPLTILSGGKTNSVFKFSEDKFSCIIRVPGNNTHKYIERKAEEINSKTASVLGLYPSVILTDNGIQVREYIEARPLTKEDLQNSSTGYLPQIVTMLKKLHQHSEPLANEIDVFKRAQFFLDDLKERKIPLPEGLDGITAKMNEISQLFSRLNIKTVPCHNDFNPSNFLLDNNGKIWLIDWERAGNNDPMHDLAVLAGYNFFNEQQETHLLKEYFGDDIPEAEHHRFKLYKPYLHYMIFLWANMEIANENTNGNIDYYKGMAAMCFKACGALLNSDTIKESLHYLQKQAPDLELATQKTFHLSK